jgi:lipopolysaccharide biosynthesis glycosyltransferase
MQTLHILTSSDSVLVQHIFTQLKNIKDNLVSRYEVHFWLFHYRIEKKDIAALAAYSEHLGTHFHEVFVYDFEDYEYLKKGAEEKFPVECYFYFLAHKYLPKDIDRALYIDAGDVIFDGDIEEFYFAPFEGNFIITSIAFASHTKLYNFDDMAVSEKYAEINSEYINSGAMVINLELMRLWNIDLDFYKNINNYILKNCCPFVSAFYKTPIYFTNDQGLFTAAFVGRIKFWGYEKYGYEYLYMPYNFRPYVLEDNKERLGIPDGAIIDLGYEPHIIHLLGNKPWQTDKATYDKLLPISRKYLDMFWNAEQAAKEDLMKLGIKTTA